MEIEMQLIRALLPLAAMLTLAGAAQAQAPFITVASTTSTEQSGLFPFLLPAFTKASGIEVHIVAVGTGQALAIGEHGDADVVFVHDKPAELKFMEAGYGIDRREVMYNDFILVGPKADPAHIGGGKDIVAALKQIAAQQQPFLSRGDSSGTDAEEKRLWGEAGIDVKTASGGWYRELGQGMGPTLNTAAAMSGYTISDRGTWLNFKNPQDLVILVEGDTKLFNQYGVMLVNPKRYPSIKVKQGMAFIDWLISPQGQAVIAQYQIGGKQLFFPNYKKPAG
jgi:tungstate transport system substrate-binding protein